MLVIIINRDFEHCSITRPHLLGWNHHRRFLGDSVAFFWGHGKEMVPVGCFCIWMEPTWPPLRSADIQTTHIKIYQTDSNWFKHTGNWELSEEMARKSRNRCCPGVIVITQPQHVRRAQTRILKMKEAPQLRWGRWGYGMILPKSCQNHGGKFGWAVHGINSSVSLTVLL